MRKNILSTDCLNDLFVRPLVMKVWLIGLLIKMASFVIAQSGDTVKFLNYDKFVPKEF